MCTCHDALLHEDLIVPVHNDNRPDEYVATLPGRDPRTIRLSDAAGLTRALRPRTEISDTEQGPDGPRLVHRRNLLAGVSAGLGALLIPSVAPRYAFAADVGAGAQRSDERDLLVVIFLRGGVDPLSLVVPDDAHFRAVRPTIGQAPNPDMSLGGIWSLSPYAAALAPMLAEGSLGLVLGAGNPPGTRSHFDEMAAMERSAPVGVRSGWLGRHLSASATEQGTFRAVTWGGSSVMSLATNFATLAMSSIATFDVAATPAAARPAVLNAVGQMYGNAGGAAAGAASAVLDAISGLSDVRGTPYVPANGALYPASHFGASLRDVAAMAKSGKGLEVACVDIGAWDMHQGLGAAGDSKGWFATQARDLAEGLAALRTDLGERWASTTVVAMSEFGRRVQENGSRGLDHGKGGVMLTAGGGVAGGLYGAPTSLEDSALNLGDLPITVDYRQVLAELLTARLGSTALPTVLPGFDYTGGLGLYHPRP